MAERKKAKSKPGDTSDAIWRRVKMGPKPVFESPEQLWEAAVEYFEWNERNPLYQPKTIILEGGGTRLEHTEHERVMTLEALCLHMNTHRSTLLEMQQMRGAYKGRSDISAVAIHVQEIIRRQKYEGATSGWFNASIISRDLGLVDRVQTENHTITEPANIDVSKLSKAAKKELLAAMVNNDEELDGGEG